jgi:hypothetical protein
MPRHRGWSALRAVAYYAALGFVIAVVALLIAGIDPQAVL